MQASIAIILDERRMKENSKYPVKLRVNFLRTTEYHQTIFDLSKADYEKLSASRVSEELQSVREKLSKLESEAKLAAEKISPFDFRTFENSFATIHPHLRKRKSKVAPTPISMEEDFDYTPYLKRFPILSIEKCGQLSLTWSYRECVKKLLRDGQVSSAMTYRCSYVSLKKFRGDVYLTAITTDYLRAYEKRMKNEGMSKTTVGMYLRPLRAVLNHAIEQRLLKKDESYPFGKGSYQIPASKKVKKALSLEEVERIYNYQCKNTHSGKHKAKDFWLFSYFGNGMNPKDMALLKWSYLIDDYIDFERAKTERSVRSNPQPITVYVNQYMRSVIERWGNSDRSPNNYIFPILEQGLNSLEEYNRVQNFVKLINCWMEEIMLNLNINKKATTYAARHTFSTIMKKAGASTEFIQEALGHTNIKTTQGYLDSFDRETKKDLAARLFAFRSDKHA